MRQSIQSLFIGLLISILLIGAEVTHAQNSGILSGSVLDTQTEDGIPLVNIVLKETSYGAATNQYGNFIISGLPPGKYTVSVSAIGYETQETEVQINSGQRTQLNIKLKNLAVEVGEVLVYGASLRRERITEAPSSISVINAEKIQRNGGHGQLARLLEGEAGIDIAQSGLFDFNINARGFNSSLNRRLLILLDGRDMGTAFLGATEWNGLSTPLEDFGRIEFVRGPGSALYGANAYNGVINISSIPPRNNPGTRISVGGGEMDAMRGDIKHAGTFDKWSYRLNVGGYQGKSFSKSRKNANFEYEGLNPVLNNEVIDLNTDPVRSIYGALRVDHEFANGSIGTIEGGLTQVENEAIVTGIGRVQVQKATRPWARLNYNGHGFNVLFWANGRHNVNPEKSLSTGLDLVQDAWITHAEAQYNFTALKDKIFVVVGASHRMVNIDTEGTLMLEKRNDNTSGLFSQIEYKVLDNLKAVAAARWDRSTLHSSRVSPKFALVWNPSNGHSIRATFNQAFQPPNYSEQYLYVKRPAEPGATSTILYRGNNKLIPEEITGYEIGYKGIFVNSVFFTFDLYFNRLKNFVTDLGPSGERYYDFNDKITYAVWSYNNAGKVDEYGFEAAVNYYLSDSWIVDANFTYFRFDVLEKAVNDILLPNTPRYKVNGGLTYRHPGGHSAEVNIKYVPTFPWAAGIFRDADIKAYTIVNLSGTFVISKLFSVNANIYNLLDREHYEILGGSLLRRRAILTGVVNF